MAGAGAAAELLVTVDGRENVSPFQRSLASLAMPVA
jgi:hypothetical protein